jgi:TolA-binding protein
MKRIRLSTLMLLVVIAALSFALVAQRRQAARREAENAAMRAELEGINLDMQKEILRLDHQQRSLEIQIDHMRKAGR